MRLNFNEQFTDIFGFEEKQAKPAPPAAQNEEPIQTFYLNKMMESLAEEKVGAWSSKMRFADEVQWGQTDGAMRARLTPNQGVSIERLTTDLQGHPLWVTKELCKIKTQEFIGHEDLVAREIADHVRLIAREPVDGPQRDYKELFVLTKEIATQVKTANQMFVFQEIKKVNDNNYNIQMSLIGSGVGRIAATGGRAARQTPVGIIDMSYDPERGTIKGILTTVDIQDEGSPWQIDIPYFMGQFSPTQPVSEICRAVIAGLKFI